MRHKGLLVCAIGGLLLVMLAAALWMPLRPAAAAPSAGCAALDGASGTFVLGISFPDLFFQAGEELAFTLTSTGDSAAVSEINTLIVIGSQGSNTTMTHTYTIPADGMYRFAMYGDSISAAVTYSITCTPVPEPGVTEEPGAAVDPGPAIKDGRLCLWDDYAVYTTDGHLDVYGISGGNGYFVLRVTQEELDAHPGAEGVNTLIKSSGDGEVQVYRLGMTDTLEVHAGLDFVRFTGLPGSNKFCGTVILP